jgi:hypothetical protein
MDDPELGLIAKVGTYQDGTAGSTSNCIKKIRKATR